MIDDELYFLRHDSQCKDDIPYRPLPGSKPSLNDKFRCPLCKEVVAYARMVEVKEDDYNCQSFDGHHMKFLVTNRSVLLCNDCASMIESKNATVKLLTACLLIGLGLIGFFIDKLGSYFQIIQGVVGTIIFFSLISIVIYRSTFLFELVGKWFNIKWRLRDYGIY